MALGVGGKAPALTLFGPARSRVDLGDHIGRQPVVLLFFPLAFTSTCTAQMCAVAEDHAAFADLDALVFGISVDAPATLDRFAAETGATFPLLSDFNREAIRAYDVVRPDLGGLRDVAERVVYVIARDGTIVYVWQGEHPGVMPPLDEIKAALRGAGAGA